MITGSQKVITTYRQVFNLTNEEGTFSLEETERLLDRVRESYMRSYGVASIPDDDITITPELGGITASYLLREEIR